MKYLATLLLLLVTGIAAAQVLPADTSAAVINLSVDSSGVTFGAELRELRQIAGAPAPFYTYFWEFGDGKFSFEKEPRYCYADSGSYDVRLYATNNYDDGKPPPTRPKKVKIPQKQSGQLASIAKPAFFKTDKGIELKTNRMPKPAEELILIIGYRNKAEWNIPLLSGKLAILYNQKEFGQDNFVLQEARTHHQEQKSPADNFLAFTPVQKSEEDWKQKGGPESIVPAKKPGLAAKSLQDRIKSYRDIAVWKFDKLKQGEERFIFMSLKTTPDMLQDTNAVVTVSAVLIPEHPFAEEQHFELELQIVASHDPNKLMLRNRKMNYRFTGKKHELTYKVRFQNTGEGPAKKVAIGVRTAGVFDLSTLKITDQQPKCLLCDSAYARQSCIDTVISRDSVHFVFKNIYLPGVKQKGVQDLDSTMGYVEYKLRFAKKPKKLPFDSQASIVFDKNEPIYTNRSIGKFRPGLSPGLMAVYGSRFNRATLNNVGKESFSFGFSLSSYAAHKKYLQWEVYVSRFSEAETFLGRKEGGDTVINRIPYRVAYKEAYSKSKIMSIDAVPAQLRYNLNSFIGLGFGALVSVNLSTSVTDFRTISLTEVKTGQNTTSTEEKPEPRKSFTDWNSTLFADVQFGRVRVGPVIGLRYLQGLTNAGNRISTYLAWRL